ncbi:TetR family transcriptional regulator [Paenibacillus graminis]|nr:TetR family transcriptional regulator [Paenibacillus graminis]MEC0169327.1 TetR family transcriptional regulator [Paenibacillus graminis]
MTTEKSGLRERKKDETRRTLSEIALNLAIERGVGQVRVEDIAAAANVSLRTFNNYFPSKEAAIIGNAYQRSETIAVALADRPPGEALKDSFRAAVLTGFSETADRQWLARTILLRDDPALIGAQRKAEIEIERNLAKVIAERAKKDLTQDIYPTLMAAMLIAAVRAAVFFWASSSPGGPTLHEILDEAISGLGHEH